MNYPELMRLVEAHESIEHDLQVSAAAVWDAVVGAEPKLADEILKLFVTREAAAQWVASKLRALGASPARLEAEGRTEEIMTVVLKSMHGLSG